MLRTTRGQTTLDFGIAMGIFLLTLAFTFSFLSGVFAPFSTDSNADLMTADRSAAHLTEGMLGSPSRPTQLNSTCTVAFFKNTTVPTTCRYDTLDLTDALGVASRTRVNTTIEQSGDVAKVDGIMLARGPPPSSTGDVSVARRLIALEGTTYHLVVRVW
ncbi:DUF7287 family protein [Haloarcula nitratireducens]|uniref:Uncharacterized protein n=1 Tax=Haloarcula nitratireducens TaxID=2487749 RepID=A0AAW4PL02_9EURY|nr:hypothetical protein [Halomicroarcula nitratireducens]MBX0298258.1 hypothetical protein [Halomicroarcula nitratireducens]